MRTYVAFIVMMWLMGCQTTTTRSPLSLVGNTVEYRYGESVYHVTFDSDSTLHWEAIAGDETGTKENEFYVADWVERQKVFITWGEASGIGVSQVLDFKQGKVHNHLLRGRDASKGTGDIRILEK